MGRHIMNVGEVRIAEDSDFALLKILLSRGDGWELEHNSGSTMVWTRHADNSIFRMIRLKTTFTDITADTLYDVLHDPVYRKTWDKHMLCSRELGVLNPNNDISYYGGNLNTVGFRRSPHVVSSGHDVKVGSSINTVSGGEDIVLVNERSTTEPSIVNEKGHLPGPLVLFSLVASDNSSSAGRSFNTTGGLQVNISSLLGGGSSFLDFLDSPGQALFSCWYHGLSGLVLAQVTSLGRSPVLFWSQPAPFGESHGHCGTKKSCNKYLHLGGVQYEPPH